MTTEAERKAKKAEYDRERYKTRRKEQIAYSINYRKTHREQVNRKQRERYAQDPEYRQKRKDRLKIYRTKHRYEINERERAKAKARSSYQLPKQCEGLECLKCPFEACVLDKNSPRGKATD